MTPAQTQLTSGLVAISRARISAGLLLAGCRRRASVWPQLQLRFTGGERLSLQIAREPQAAFVLRTAVKGPVESVLISAMWMQCRCGGLLRRSVRLRRTPLLAMTSLSSSLRGAKRRSNPVEWHRAFSTGPFVRVSLRLDESCAVM